MSQEFDTTGRSSELNEFESQLRRFQPLPAENAEKMFYQAGWNAAELAWKDRQSKSASPLNFFTNSFTRGLVVGMAVALLVAVCLPGAVRLWSGRGEIAKSTETTASHKENPIPADSTAAIDSAQNNDAVSDAAKSPADEPLSLALKSETISQIFPWNWKSADRPTATFPRASEASILGKAFDHSWLGLVRTDSAPLTGDSASGDEPAVPREPPLRTSPLDIQRVLDFY